MKAECEPQYFGDVSKKIIHGDAIKQRLYATQAIR